MTALPATRLNSRLALAVLLVGVGLALIVAWLLTDRIAASAAYEKALVRYKAMQGPDDPAALKPPSLPKDRDATTIYLKALEVELSDYDQERDPEIRKTLSDDARLLSPDEDPPTEEQWKELEDLVKERSGQIDDLLKAASAGPVRYPLHYEQGWMMLMPHISELLSAGKLLSWDIRLRLGRSVREGLWQRIDALFGVADTLTSEPVMVSQLVRMSLLNRALSEMEQALGALPPPPAPWREKLAKRLDPEHPWEGVRRAWFYELAMNHETVARFMAGQKTYTELDRDLPRWSKWWARPKLCRGAARGFNRLLRLQAIIDRPLEQAIQESEAVTKDFQGDPLSFSFIVSNYPGILRQQAATATRLRMAQEALDLRGRHPDLAAMPESIAELRRDPLFGRPITYQRTQEGFVLDVAATSEELQTRWGIEDPLKWSCLKKSE